jgi:hypothetical protein
MFRTVVHFNALGKVTFCDVYVVFCYVHYVGTPEGRT